MSENFFSWTDVNYTKKATASSFEYDKDCTTEYLQELETAIQSAANIWQHCQPKYLS